MIENISLDEKQKDLQRIEQIEHECVKLLESTTDPKKAKALQELLNKTSNTVEQLKKYLGY